MTVRKARGLSQEELAHRCGMHRNAVSNLERGTSNRDPFISDPLLSTVYRLASALDVAPALLLPDLTATPPARSAELGGPAVRSEVEAELHRLIVAGDGASG